MGLFSKKEASAAVTEVPDYTDAELLAMEHAPVGAHRYSWGQAYDLYRRWEDLHHDKQRVEQESALKQYQAKDEAAKIAARAFRPDVSNKAYAAGEFLCVGEHEIPRRFIENIVVESIGGAPFLTFSTYIGWCAADAVHGLIGITLASGKCYRLACSRHSIDAMFEAVTNAWKHGTAGEAA